MLMPVCSTKQTFRMDKFHFRQTQYAFPDVGVIMQAVVEEGLVAAVAVAIIVSIVVVVVVAAAAEVVYCSSYRSGGDGINCIYGCWCWRCT